jgi:hypothetical protein
MGGERETPVMSISEAIKRANSLLPGAPVAEGEEDPRWQAIIGVGDFVETNPDEVWQFARRWAGYPQEDVRDAIACCLLEHLLEHHFRLILPRIEQAIAEDRLFADAFSRCWKFGLEAGTDDSKEFDRLQAQCREGRGQ